MYLKRLFTVLPLALLLLLPMPTSGFQDGIVGFGIDLYQDLCCQACHDALSTLFLNCTTFMEQPEGEGGSDEGMSDMGGMGMDMDMDMPMGMTSDECRATNLPWLQTMAHCIRSRCDADGYPYEKQVQCFSKHAVAGASEPTFEASLPHHAPMVELPVDAMWLNETSLVNGESYYSIHGTLGEFAREEYLHSKYSIIICLLTIGTILVCGLFNQITGRFPTLQKRLQGFRIRAKLRQSILLPALWGTRHLEPLPGRLGYVPNRALTLFIALFVLLNIVFSAVSFRSFQPNIYWFSSGFELCEYVGNRTGILSLVNIGIAVLFAGRNHLLLLVTGWSQTTFLTLHRWAARVATVQAVVHSIVYTQAYFEPGYGGAKEYASKAAEPYFYWGIIATIAICLAVAFAILPFRIRFYEAFLLTHIALVILALAATWYHLVPHFGYDYGYQVWLYIAFAFWGAERLARVARLLYYNSLASSQAVVEAIPNCNILQATVFPRTTAGFGPGQHSFLYFPGLGKFWESHPFSVAGWRSGTPSTLASSPGSGSVSNNGKEKSKEATGRTKRVPNVSKNARETQLANRASIRFLTRVHAGATATLQRRVLSSPHPRLEMTVYTEGPYAGHPVAHQALLHTDTVVCVIGGIGITNALGFVQAYASRPQSRAGGDGEDVTGKRGRSIMRHTTRFILAWSARELPLIEHVQQNFLRGVEGIECMFWCTVSSSSSASSAMPTTPKDEGIALEPTLTTAAVQEGRMDTGKVIRSVVEDDDGRHHHTTVISCGPGAMTDEVRSHVVDCVKDGFQVDLIEEAYAW
ncbi:hypothetical protein PG996_011998 [Apiospora saccharicola]|uniref:FAD-binding FR-type domain-containing protein n=1 Tax=Apiospora saccharicola TaxID=335842 RepID=A0ABR1U1D7_9PEZI